MVSLNYFTIDQLESARLVITILSALATIGVWIGVYFEGDKFSEHTRQQGWRFLLIALAAETICAIVLVQLDATISIRQKKEIVTLEQQIAPRRLTTAQQKLIKSTVDKFPGRSVVVSSYGLDAESAILCDQIAHPLVADDPKATNACMSISALGAINFGIHVTGDDADLTRALLGLFSSFGIAAVNTKPIFGSSMFISGGATMPASASIFVGVKPLSE